MLSRVRGGTLGVRGGFGIDWGSSAGGLGGEHAPAPKTALPTLCTSLHCHPRIFSFSRLGGEHAPSLLHQKPSAPVSIASQEYSPLSPLSSSTLFSSSFSLPFIHRFYSTFTLFTFIIRLLYAVFNMIISLIWVVTLSFLQWVVICNLWVVTFIPLFPPPTLFTLHCTGWNLRALLLYPSYMAS